VAKVTGSFTAGPLSVLYQGNQSRCFAGRDNRWHHRAAFAANYLKLTSAFFLHTLIKLIGY
jgi:hypothetical protein